MAEFLSLAWVDELDRVARALPDGDGPVAPLVVEQEITGPRGTARYQVHVSAAEVSVHAGAPTAADVVLVTDLATAVELHTGTVRAQDALAEGRIKVRGRPEVLRACAPRLAQLAAATGALRATTVLPDAPAGP
jgi:putative sterol carrier protein